jgi:thiol:disulfide interchange protein
MNYVCALFVLTLAAASPAIGTAAEPVYPEPSRARADIDAALKEAAASRKRVLVDFGGNWCPDCKVLDINFHKPDTAALLKEGYVLVHVNVGVKGITDNFDVAERYGIPLRKGVPALAVLESDGSVVHSQKNGEFESMRKLDPDAVNAFLRKWRR